ncbi:hypothetical protein HPP92_010937 [Vanilla planifolia]|uniref:SAC domain-containing protein n=1 Tax=Vanilla planifolia TaxID=51239 RepID=A0A835QWM7_VANPL|nr:hypothetical protein HPP92_010937 [Vanilla planifolia]
MAAVDDVLVADRSAGGCYLQKFTLYETRSKFYMIGRDETKTLWRVLKVDRLDPSELNIWEDSTTYSETECNDLLKQIHDGNKSTGGLKFVTNFYGIVGFVKFLGPYYMLLITKRRLIGDICGHHVYAITKSAMITVPNSNTRSNMSIPKNENRYKKLLSTVDLTKDFFFSYSYHVMRSLQSNLCDAKKGQVVYESMFVWNEFLTRDIRNCLKNTFWTVALVYGFFTQEKLLIAGKFFKLTLIARRSRHYAGTRYLKRGVNDKGSVANDVETEQIVFEDIVEGNATQISSIVQNRGSIPLFWSQSTSKLNLKPDIILQKKDTDYDATRLHFKNLVKRYGNPIIILNLIKTQEKKPRESILRAEFANAIDFLNKDLSGENRLKFLHWDLHKHMRRRATNVLLLLSKVAAYALCLTGFFHCQVMPILRLDSGLNWPDTMNDFVGELLCKEEGNKSCNGCLDGIDLWKNESQDSAACPKEAMCEYSDDMIESFENYLVKMPMIQTGVLRTNCIDCLDRTNVAQYVYGLVSLGYQLHALGLIDDPKLDFDSPLANALMNFYERMGDTLALQYGGSAAHKKVFSERRGQWKAATQSQEFFRTLQRYYSNAYMDAEKQKAINLFLGYFQPEQDKVAIWELNSDDNCFALKHDKGFCIETPRSSIKRSLSVGSILQQHKSPLSNCCINSELPKLVMSAKTHEAQVARILSDSAPEISACRSDLSLSRYTPTMPCRRLFAESEHGYLSELAFDASTSSNFLDLDQISISGNSCNEIYERSTGGTNAVNSPVANLSTDNVANGLVSDAIPPVKEIHREKDHSISDLPRNLHSLTEFSDSFVNWVIHGETLSST